jgi:integrative and conjugative element protein (TIGR02256 family)
MREVLDLVFRTRDRRFGLALPEKRLGEILAFCRKEGWNETGGLLIGRYSDQRDLAIVSHVTGPARDSASGRAWFHRGVEGLQDLLFRHWRQQEYYLGEWHSHPGAAPVPSGTDAAQMKLFARAADYHCPEPVLLIVGGDLRSEWTLYARVYLREGAPQDMEQDMEEET